MERGDTTVDAFLGGKVEVEQPVSGFRSGLDAVFLAAACAAEPGDKVLEAGCGAGAAALCLAARVPGLAVTAVELDGRMAELARSNAGRNGLARSFVIINGDVTAPFAALEAAGVGREAYDWVVANPPFFTIEETEARRAAGVARTMAKDGLERWLRFLAAAAKPSGGCALIYPASLLPRLLVAFGGRFGGLEVTPLHPKAAQPAIRIVVVGRKGSRAPLSLLPGIVLHEEDGSPTPQSEAILRRGAALRG
jgi:tRNA1(Val) A37 N6-methylase TrmN6